MWSGKLKFIWTRSLFATVSKVILVSVLRSLISNGRVDIGRECSLRLENVTSPDIVYTPSILNLV